MEEYYEDDLLDELIHGKRLPPSFKTLSVLSYIGNGMIAIVMLILAISGLSGTGFLTDINESSVSGTVVLIMTIAFVILFGLCVLSIIGIVRMGRKKKSGLIIYGIANGIYLIGLLFGMIANFSTSSLFAFLICVTFYGYYLSLNKYLS